jgi:glutamate racemase
MSDSRPIGIFDSGIGGLTVAKAISRHLPNEQLIYFGDTAHLPYGDKSPDAIRYYCLRIGKFLLDKKCKAVVIACNTASSLGYNDLQEMIGAQVPVINVIDPVVEHLTSHAAYRNIGVIGTKGTIKSDIYAQKILEKKPSVQVNSLATPLLAPMIEEGFFNNNISKTIIHSYLQKSKLRKIDSLILACTHYPLIKPEIEGFYKGKVYIVDQAEIVAAHVKQTLEKAGLLNKNNSKPHQFFVSDFTKSFEKSTRLFFGGKIHLRHEPIWGS